MEEQNLNALYESILKFMSEYKEVYEEVKENGDWSNPFGALVSKSIPTSLENSLSLNSNYFVKGSYGKGLWTSVPWIAIFDRRITTTAQKGVYIVLLLNKDTKELFLTLNQGATSIDQEGKKQDKLTFTGIAGASSKKSLIKLEEKAKAIKESLNVDLSGFEDRSDSGSKSYDAGAICCKKYTVESLLSGQQLIDDIKKVLALYEKYYDLYHTDGNQPSRFNLTGSNLKDTIDTVKAYIKQKGFTYDEGVIENLYLSIKSKPFVLLAGTSGTGKTRLVRLFSEAIGANYKMVPVRPDWSDSSDLFGYVDLNGRFVKGSIIDFVKEAQDNPDKPYILCLDEMNLARVEYYLSDFLSIVETRDYKDGSIVSDPLVSLSTYKTDVDAQSHYGEIVFPENLYLIGTVNMDETTFPFSRKVLDRANTIEFNSVEVMPHFEEKPAEPVDSLTVDNSFLKTNYLFLVDCEDKEYVTDICKELNSFNGALKKVDSQIGYRIRDEIVFYMLNNHVAGDLLSKKDAFDNCLMQKILPRLQGSSMALRDTLVLLYKDCLDDNANINNSTDMYEYLDSGNDIVYPKSAAKIAYMTKRLEEDGFTSYWL